MPHATVDGIRVGYDDVGEGEPPLVFTTGWCSSRRRWQRVAELCAVHRRVLNTEWRGHGDSGRDNTPSENASPSRSLEGNPAPSSGAPSSAW